MKIRNWIIDKGFLRGTTFHVNEKRQLEILEPMSKDNCLDEHGPFWVARHFKRDNYNWMVEYGSQNGNLKRKFFKNKSDANKFITKYKLEHL